MENSRNFTKLLRKYVADQCTSEELEIILAYLKTEEGRHALQNVLEEEAMGYDESPSIDPSISNRIYHQLQENIRETVAQKEVSLSRNIVHVGFLPKLAASVAGIILISVALYLTLFRATSTVYVTDYGETKTLTFPDSSVITLNANSKVTYHNHWNADQPREIWLEGEAFFSVQHTKNDQKFLVHTSGLDVEVLGTEFNVNNRRGKTTVVLDKGSIRLNALHLNHPLLMQPGELVEYNEQSTNFQQKLVNPEVYTSWKNHHLVFDGTTIREIAQILEDNFGLEVVLKDDSLGQKEFKGSVPSHDLDILLKGLSESFNIEVTRDNNTIVIANKNPATASENSE